MAMVKITVKCSVCGRDFEHRHECNNSAAASSYKEWALENITVCPACFSEKKEAERQAQIESELLEQKNVSLCELTGSEKQIEWAKTIRYSFFDKILLKRHPLKLYEYSASIADSKFWIENRDNLLMAIAEKFKKENEK